MENNPINRIKECIKNLELVETMRNKDRQNSLLGFMDKTKTAMGSRLLKSYIIIMYLF
jgi:DNA mismatch repair ATPase MutS